MTEKLTFSRPRLRLLNGIVMALVTATVLIPGMTVYLPLTIGDRIALPILLFPFIWTALFIYSFMAKVWWHPWALMGSLLIIHGGLIAFSLI